MFNSQTNYRAEKIINGVFLVLFMASFAVSMFLSLLNVAPASYINLLQALIMDGEYMPVLSGLLLVIPQLVMLMILKTVIVLLYNLLVVKEGTPKIPYSYKIRWK